ncbi:hypothetical protein LEP1GSC050_1830 [Leptospira broomii serovar Hurstbridge str. 5399]|uniref:Uncharacterized protein n=1 Tax=Leptospira broomii serovar Hurstbridge str. 5399 TaxID=1049789 RepID=T0GAE6_9LEPT|nr:hypothetical protein [Leptospira broomii]EQA43799.1 hypothetical protein LEP1GSC050_1830 [Leptospira broomii serovar Hurstbridge str. 5399]
MAKKTKIVNDQKLKEALDLYNYINQKINEYKASYSEKGFLRDLMVLNRIKLAIMENDIDSLNWIDQESKGIADTLGAHVDEPDFTNKMYNLLNILSEMRSEHH